MATKIIVNKAVQGHLLYPSDVFLLHKHGNYTKDVLCLVTYCYDDKGSSDALDWILRLVPLDSTYFCAFELTRKQVEEVGFTPVKEITITYKV